MFHKACKSCIDPKFHFVGKFQIFIPHNLNKSSFEKKYVTFKNKSGLPYMSILVGSHP